VGGAGLTSLAPELLSSSNDWGDKAFVGPFVFWAAWLAYTGVRPLFDRRRRAGSAHSP